MDKLLIGFITCGGLGAIAYLFISFRQKGSDIKEAVHLATQKLKIKGIEKTKKKQTILNTNIENNKKLEVETRQKIEDIKKKAEVEIKKTLKSDKNAVDVLIDINKELEGF